MGTNAADPAQVWATQADIGDMSVAAIRGLMEDGERVLGEDVVEGANGKATPLVVTSRAFYLSVGGRYTRYAYNRVRAATFDAHDIFIALDGQAVRMKYRQGTARSDALQALRRQVALARL